MEAENLDKTTHNLGEERRRNHTFLSLSLIRRSKLTFCQLASTKKKYTQENLQEIIGKRMPEDLKKTFIEINTVNNLRKMYFQKPGYLNNLEQMINDFKLNKRKQNNVYRSTFYLGPPSVFVPYLDKLKNKIKLFERDESKESNEGPASYFKRDEDDLFTNSELRTIEIMKHKYSFEKITRDNLNPMANEVWEWNEFEKNYFLSQGKDDSSIEYSRGGWETGSKRITEPDPEERVGNSLIKWFTKESPPSKFRNDYPQFKFYKSRTLNKFMFMNNDDRLKAAVKFLKLAKNIYPDLDQIKVLGSLQLHTGPAPPDLFKRQIEPIKTLPKIRKKLRYFKKILHEAGELRKMFESGNKKEDSTVQTFTPEMEKKHLENCFKDALAQKKTWWQLYMEYIENDLLPPFDELFMRTAIGLTRYDYLSNKLGGNKYKEDVPILIGELLKLILESFRWFVDSLFRNDSHSYSRECKFAVDNVIANLEEGILVHKEEPDSVIKKLMVNIIRGMSLIRLIEMKDSDSSSKCTENEEEEGNALDQNV